MANIISRYEDITNLFPEQLKAPAIFPLFAEWLLSNVTMVEIRAFSTDNAYIIFETMNDRGLSLNPTEIIKAYLLSKIEDEDKADEMNTLWKERIQAIKNAYGDEGDMSFFRDWLRAKYAVSKRQKSANSSNEDFELIGSQYHTWVKNNDKRMGLKSPKDYYLFIKSDFDYYTGLYRRICKHRIFQYESLAGLFVTAQYCIADSLYMPLMMSPVTKLDDEEMATKKLDVVNRFIDRFVNLRTLKGRTVTQSAVRDMIFDLIKDIRNCDIDTLTMKLNEYRTSELWEFDDSIFLHSLSSSYMHYFFARMKYHDKSENIKFSSFMRSRKKNSYVLYQIFKSSDFSETEIDDKYIFIQSLCNYCIVHRQDVDDINKSSKYNRITTLKAKGYLEEMSNEHYVDESVFWIARKDVLGEYICKIWL